MYIPVSSFNIIDYKKKKKIKYKQTEDIFMQILCILLLSKYRHYLQSNYCCSVGQVLIYTAYSDQSTGFTLWNTFPLR